MFQKLPDPYCLYKNSTQDPTFMPSYYNWKCLQTLSKALQETRQSVMKATTLGIIQGWESGKIAHEKYFCGKLCYHSGVLGASPLIYYHCHFVFRKFWNILLLRTTSPEFSNYLLLLNFISPFYTTDHHVFISDSLFPLILKHILKPLLIFLPCHFFASTVFPLFKILESPLHCHFALNTSALLS